MTAANFADAALPFTLLYEGGRANDPRDPGGRTNQGVTQKTFTAYLQARGLPARDVFSMSDAERDDLYHRNFWTPVGGDLLPDGVDLACFDYGVNSGPSRARKAYAARASNDAVTVVKNICAARLSFDRGLAIWNTFGKGWTARVAACEALAVKMALHARSGHDVTAAATPGTVLVLNAEAKSARAGALAGKRRAGVTAVGGATVGGAAAHPAVAGVGSYAWPLLLISGLAIALVIALALWRALQNQARADAYLKVAKADERQSPVPAAPVVQPS